jgi:glycosyltransferase involved in cell wall biosynthesis
VVAAEVRRARPDVVVTWNLGCAEAARVALDAGVPALVWVPDAAFGAYLDALPAGATIAGCSHFVVGRLSARRGRATALLRPLVRLDGYRAGEQRPAHVTMIDPRWHKGVDVTLAVAERLRHRRFVLVESRQASLRERLALRVRVGALANVSLLPPQSSLRAVYAGTSVLLAPSQVEDASPRVILEAHVNGVPVVGSRTGGIPEVMGEGGLLCAPEASPAAWADAIEAALADRPRLSARAVANAARAELSPAAVLSTFLALTATPVAA